MFNVIFSEVNGLPSVVGTVPSCSALCPDWISSIKVFLYAEDCLGRYILWGNGIFLYFFESMDR